MDIIVIITKGNVLGQIWGHSPMISERLATASADKCPINRLLVQLARSAFPQY
jgi:hypothetical protein